MAVLNDISCKLSSPFLFFLHAFLGNSDIYSFIEALRIILPSFKKRHVRIITAIILKLYTLISGELPFYLSTIACLSDLYILIQVCRNFTYKTFYYFHSLLLRLYCSFFSARWYNFHSASISKCLLLYQSRVFLSVILSYRISLPNSFITWRRLLSSFFTVGFCVF